MSAASGKLARTFHPDVNRAAGAEEKFKEINGASQVLGDADRRARYDQMFDAYQHGGMDWQQMFGQGAAQTPGGWTVTFGGEGLEDLLGGLGFSDFFKQIFGAEAGAARTGGRAGMDELLRGQGGRPAAESSIGVSLEEAFAGARKSFAVQLNGTTRRFDVAIPKGVRSGQRIRLPGALDGNDLYLTVQVQPHPHFERRDGDVLIEVPVTASEAALGATIEGPTLEGKAEMTIPPGTHSGPTVRPRGQGMPRPGRGPGGPPGG